MSFSNIPHESKLCGAHARSTGKPCRRLAMPNGRCDMHGGKSLVKNGMRTKKAITEKMVISQLISDSKSLIKDVDQL